MTIRNVLELHETSINFAVQNFAKESFKCIERFFTTLAETKDFTQLNRVTIFKILASSGLNTTSELEIFNAADSWLGHNAKERVCFAESLLLKVRLSLMSDATLNSLLKKTCLLARAGGCVQIIKEVLQSKKSLVGNDSKDSYRFCAQEKFNVLTIGGIEMPDGLYDYQLDKKWFVKNFGTVDDVYQLHVNNFKTVKKILPVMNKRLACRAVCLKGVVYVFCGYDRSMRLVSSIEKYTIATNTWTKATDMVDDRQNYSVCAFMDKIFIVGGCYRNGTVVSNCCLYYDTKNCNFDEVRRMNEPRQRSACTAFKGNVVVAGGRNNASFGMKSVIMYDSAENEWSPLPTMVNRMVDHSLVAVRKMLYAIGSDSCEVLDDACKMFVALKSPLKASFFNNVVLVGSKIFIYEFKAKKLISYNIEKKKWSQKKELLDVENFNPISLVKFPLI